LLISTRTPPSVVAFKIKFGRRAAVIVLGADVLLGTRSRAPMWTCSSSGPPTVIRVPATTGRHIEPRRISCAATAATSAIVIFPSV
jgi:hypothetical protein